ncbi:pyridoxal phosphate-dependent aminotransferase [bacterium]|nr:pyridoxal phosphate-dependent aminotransferase [bacterium]
MSSVRHKPLTFMLSNKIQSIHPSLTLTIAQKASDMVAKGLDVILLSLGEPDFTTPLTVKEAAHLAIESNMTYYTPVDGTAALKEAICLKLSRDNNLQYQPNEIIVSNGCKQAIFNTLYSLLNPGDEVIIGSPYWVSYPEMVTACDGTPIFVQTTLEDRFLLTAKKLAQAITPKTKMVILNSPANPSGQNYNKEELQAIADLLIHYPQIFICSDDVYETILWKGKYFNILNVAPELKPRTILVNGVSKSHAMTGWRIGYAAADKILIAALKKIQSQTTSNPCSISQVAATAALNQHCAEEHYMQQEYKRRHEFLFQGLRSIPFFTILPSQGTFYLWVDITKALEHLNIANDFVFAEQLLHEGLVSIVPGSGFGMPGFIRISFTADIPILTKAIERIKAFIAKNT